MEIGRDKTMTDDLDNLRKWILKKHKNGQEFLSAAKDAWGIELTTEQIKFMEARILQLEEIDNVILEFIEERDKPE